MARAPHAPRVRAPTQRQRAAVEGKEFEDEGAMWWVLDVAWSGDYQEMVVFYYDIDGVSEEELKEIEDTDDFALSELDAVEGSALKEVPKWTKAAVQSTAERGERGTRKRVRRAVQVVGSRLSPSNIP